MSRPELAEAPRSAEPEDLDGAPVTLPPGSDLIELEDGLVIIAIPIAPPKLPASLTAAERDIVLRVCEGQSNAEIARQRGPSVVKSSKYSEYSCGFTRSSPPNLTHIWARSSEVILSRTLNANDHVPEAGEGLTGQT
jgi:hypothetical protein